jgi:NAD+ synthase
MKSYASNAGAKGFIVGVSGGIDSALTAHLSALTGLKVLLLNMPIRQKQDEFDRGIKQIKEIEQRFPNVEGLTIPLDTTFAAFLSNVPDEVSNHFLSMANSRSRLRMMTLYAVGQANNLLVAGTGNKVEDFGVGFYTKYGDGGVDLSPIADLMKSEVYALAREVGVIKEILDAPPTDGLWEDGRSDEEQIGATYDELEWAMEFSGTLESLTDRQKKVLKIYQSYHNQNKHKMVPIPVCEIPTVLKNNS